MTLTLETGTPSQTRLDLAGELDHVNKWYGSRHVLVDVSWAKAHPREWAQNYAAAVGMDPRVAAVSQARNLRVPTELGDAVVASEQRLADLFAAAGQIQSSPKFAKWVDRRFNDVLRANLVDAHPVHQAAGH